MKKTKKNSAGSSGKGSHGHNKKSPKFRYNLKREAEKNEIKASKPLEFETVEEAFK